MLEGKLLELYQMLSDSEQRVLIHCSAGIHRTGCIGYTLLRMDGKDHKAAFEALNFMRLETFTGVCEWRLEIMDTMLVPLLQD